MKAVQQKGSKHSHWLGDFYTIRDLYRLCGRVQLPTHNSARPLHKSLPEATMKRNDTRGVKSKKYNVLFYS